MPTNEERREVAARLRKRECELQNLDVRASCINAYMIGKTCEDYTTCRDCTRTALSTLADLIEPEPERTCRNKHPRPSGFWCSECDAATDSFIDVSGALKKVRRCPNCGAKVVIE